MSSRNFWTIFIIIFALLSFSQPINWAAYVAYYIPPTLIVIWIIFWYIQYLFFSIENIKLLNQIYKFSFWSFFSVVGLSFLFSIVLFGISFIKEEKIFSQRGHIKSIQKQYMPFIRSFGLKLVTIETTDKKKLVILPRTRFNQSIWIGEKVLISKPSDRAITMIKFEFDSMMWHSEILSKWPSSKKSWQEVMSALDRQQRLDDLVKWIPRYTKNFGADDFLTEMGNHYWLKGDLTQTVQFYEAAHKGTPNDYNILKYYGFYLAKSGKRPEGIRLLEEATKIQPDNFEAFYQLGHTLIESGKSQEAIPILERTLELNPNLADIKAALNNIKRQPSNDN